MAASTPSAGADIQRAARLLAEERSEEAIAVLEALTSAFPAYVTAHVLAARAYETAGRPSDALQAWHRAQFLMPASPLIARHRLRLLQQDLEDGDSPDGDAIAPPEVAAPSIESRSAPTVEPDVAEDPAASRTDQSYDRSEEPEAPPEPESESSQAGHSPSFEEFAWIEEAEILPPYDTKQPESTPSPDAGDGWRVVDDLDRQESVSPDQHEADASVDDSFSEAAAGSADAPSSQSAPHERSDPGPADQHEASDQDDEQGDWVRLDASATSGERTAGTSSDERDPMAGLSDLDALIEQLENAPRIRPPDPASGSAESDLADGDEEVVTETLARIYEAQGQYAAAARAYDALAREHPQREEEFFLRAAELRRRGAN